MNNIIITALSAIFVLGLLVFIHELGHFTVAKCSGIKVLQFALGMGPVLVKYQGKETEYSIRILPIGGFVMMEGEQQGSISPRAFCNQSPWIRICAIAAGPIMNFILAVVLYFLICFNLGYIKPVISEVSPNSPAQLAGLMVNDKIVEVNNSRIRTYSDFRWALYENKDKKFTMKVKRDNTYKELAITPVINKDTKQYIIGVSMTQEKGGNVISALSNGTNETISSIKLMVLGLKGLVTGTISADNVGGPVTIIKMSGDAAKQGVWNLLAFAAFLSINLGVMNLIPFPALDGGLITVFLFEAVTRKKIDENRLGTLNYIGFVALMVLMLLVTFKDIVNIFF